MALIPLQLLGQSQPVLGKVVESGSGLIGPGGVRQKKTLRGTLATVVRLHVIHPTTPPYWVSFRRRSPLSRARRGNRGLLCRLPDITYSTQEHHLGLRVTLPDIDELSRHSGAPSNGYSQRRAT